MVRAVVCAIVLVVAGIPGRTASAQGLLWNLPEDKSWVRFEGTLKQTEIREGDAAGNEALDWIRHVTIKSVGREDAEFEGATVPCRWIEFKVVTGRPSDKGIEPGPVGARIVKVLVPESRIGVQLPKAEGDEPGEKPEAVSVGTRLVKDPRAEAASTLRVVSGDLIPVSFVPVVKGFRKTGEGPVQPLTGTTLNLYPLLSPMMNYRTLTEAEGDEDPMVPLNTVKSAHKFTGQLTLESPTVRTENSAEFWATNDVPFGLAKWDVKEVRSLKDRAQTRDQFHPVSEVELKMSVHATGDDAESELQTPAE